MNKTKQLRAFLVVAILLSGLADVFNLVSDNVAKPIFLLSLAWLLMMRSHEYKKEGDKVGVLIMSGAGIFLMITMLVGIIFN